MIIPSGTRIWLAAGVTDMRRGFDGLAAIVQEQLAANPFSGHVFIFRGRPDSKNVQRTSEGASRGDLGHKARPWERRWPW